MVRIIIALSKWVERPYVSYFCNALSHIILYNIVQQFCLAAWTKKQTLGDFLKKIAPDRVCVYVNRLIVQRECS